MADIQTLVNQVLARAEQEEQAKLQAFETETDEALKKAKAQIDETTANEKRHIEEAEAKKLQTQKQSYLNTLRNEKLQAKQALLDSVYQEAIVGLQQLSSEEFTGLIQGAYSQLDTLENAELKIGEFSQHQFDADQVRAINDQVQIAAEFIPKRSGFIISQNDVDYNFTFEAIIEQKKAVLAPKLVKHAF
ncbi:hypothetical protein EF384_00090 [Aerococcus agrisoli]|uniref:ATPase n=1 Tax=Aerococcus agrisoli TaxID=2487350 RepID=A0A3N4GX83_9LACT|nr:hypothetical protein [Aerococcus agrisoli]RPA65438.1 hypothetical protein EF384_00090 [Aerococcus agrisoli]